MGYGGWDDPLDVGYDDPGPPDLSPLPEPGPSLINLPIGMGPDVNMPDPVAGGSLDWASLAKLLGITGGAVGGGGNKSPLAGLFGGGDMSSILGLLALLGGIGSGINAGNKAKQGGQEIKDAANKSNEIATDLFGKAQANFAPYQQAGQSALTGLQTPVNLADKFVSKGTPSALGNQFQGAMTLAQLAKR